MKLVSAKEVLGMEFPSEDALKEYLKEHPGADKTKHKVKKTKRDQAKETWQPSGTDDDFDGAVQRDLDIFDKDLSVHLGYDEDEAKQIMAEARKIIRQQVKDVSTTPRGRNIEVSLDVHYRDLPKYISQAVKKVTGYPLDAEDRRTLRLMQE